MVTSLPVTEEVVQMWFGVSTCCFNGEVQWKDLLLDRTVRQWLLPFPGVCETN